MLSCSQCQRFLRENALSCPFCGSARATTLAPVAAAIALGVMLVGCGPTGAGDDGDTTGSNDTSASEPVTMTVADDDGPVTSPGTNNTTSPSTTDATTVGTSVTGAESTSTSEGDDDVVDDNGCAFYGGCPFDGGNTNLECDVWAQDCPADEKCMPWANDGGPRWNATRCSPLDPASDQPGDPCLVEGSAVSGIDTCVISSMCWDVDPDTNAGTCVAFCGGSEANPICDEGLTCMSGYLGTVNVCVPTCDPGLLCLEADAVSADCIGSCCTEFCSLLPRDPNTACSLEGTMCVPFFADPPPQYEQVGVCVIPE